MYISKMKQSLFDFWSMKRLVGCFGLNSSFRQYFSLYQPTPREREQEKIRLNIFHCLYRMGLGYKFSQH